MLAAPWFTRLWVLQGVVLARSYVSMYGRFSLYRMYSNRLVEVDQTGGNVMAALPVRG
jgi:hypothetical protein